MPRLLPSCAACASLLLSPAATAQKEDKSPGSLSEELPAVSLLKKGSTLEGVMLPRYDEQLRLVAVLRAELLEVINAETVDGTKVRIDLHRPEGGQRGSVNMTKARLDQEKQLLRASEGTTISSEDMSAQGSGLVFSLESGCGFLLGPVATQFYLPAPATSMNPPATSHWTAAVGTALWLPLIAAPAPLTEQELATIDARAASSAPVADKHEKATRELTEVAEKRSGEADHDLGEFLQAAGLTSLLADDASAPPPADKPPEVPLEPDDTQVDCDGGMYFDTAAGVLVYLKNIRLRDPRFELDCRKELKIFLEKEEEKKKPDGDKANPAPQDNKPPGDEKPPKPDAKKPANLADKTEGDLFGGGKFGEIRQIVASGGVRATRKDDKGKAVVATGETAIYDGKTGDVILRGGYPAIRQGGSSLVAQEPGLYIRLYQNGDIYAQPGRWKTIADNLGEAKPGK